MTPIVPAEPVFVAQQTFRTLLTAMSRPGTMHHLSLHADESPEFAICFALLDFEVAHAIVNTGARSDAAIADFEQRIALHTGSPQSDRDGASFIIAYGPLPDSAWASVRRGTLAFPDGGATIIYVLPTVGETVSTMITTRLTLTGPGIETAQDVMLSGLPGAEFGALSRANSDYPMGVDTIFVDAAGCVTCIPRSTKITVQSTSAQEG